MATGEQYLFFQINRLHHVFSFSLLFFRMYVCVCVCVLFYQYENNDYSLDRQEVFFCGLYVRVHYIHLRTNQRPLQRKKNNKNDDAKNIKKKRKKKRKKDRRAIVIFAYIQFTFSFSIIIFQ